VNTRSGDQGWPPIGTYANDTETVSSCLAGAWRVAFVAVVKKSPQCDVLHCGLGLAAPTAPDLLHPFYFQTLSSRI
jgi:hypothetical protein